MTLRMLFFESAAEFLKAWRLPSFVLPSLLFPIGFYCLFGLIIPSATGRSRAALFYLATYGVFAAMGPSLFGFGVGIASERTEGWLELKRLAPVPGWIIMAGKLIMATLFSMIVLIILYGLAAYAGGVRLERIQWFALTGAHLMTVPPMGLLGLTLGLLLRPQAAAGVINIVMLALAALGGLFIPLSVLPASLQAPSVLLPTRHLAELSLSAAGLSVGFNPLVNVAVCVGFTLLFGLTALLAWRQATRN